MRTICLTLSMWKVVDQTKWRSMVEIMLGVSLQRHHAVLHLLSSSSFLSKVNCSGAAVQVISCHCYLVIVHAIVEQLTSLDLFSIACCHLLFSSPTLRYRNATMSQKGTQTMRKPIAVFQS